MKNFLIILLMIAVSVGLYFLDIWIAANVWQFVIA